jgi:hypothetical protein
MPVVVLLVAPVLACFVGGVIAAAARSAVARSTAALAAPGRPWPDNVVPFAPLRRRA